MENIRLKIMANNSFVPIGELYKQFILYIFEKKVDGFLIGFFFCYCYFICGSWPQGKISPLLFKYLLLLLELSFLLLLRVGVWSIKHYGTTMVMTKVIIYVTEREREPIGLIFVEGEEGWYCFFTQIVWKEFDYLLV